MRRDLRGLLRFPLRLIVWALVGLGAGSLIATLFATPGETTVLAFVAPLLVYFTVGGLAEGLHMHGAALGSASPYGLGSATITLLHALVPTGAAIVLIEIGALLTALAIAAPIGSVVSWALMLVLFGILMQVFTAVKGPVPLKVLAPVPTPAGDMSAINLVMWLLDAVIIVVLIGGAATALAASGLFAAGAILLGVAALGILVWAAVRHGKLTRPE